MGGLACFERLEDLGWVYRYAFTMSTASMQ